MEIDNFRHRATTLKRAISARRGTKSAINLSDQEFELLAHRVSLDMLDLLKRLENLTPESEDTE
jgi:hypothetical protein